MGLQVHTKFQSNRPNRYRVTASGTFMGKGCAVLLNVNEQAGWSGSNDVPSPAKMSWPDFQQLFKHEMEVMDLDECSEPSSGEAGIGRRVRAGLRRGWIGAKSGRCGPPREDGARDGASSDVVRLQCIRRSWGGYSALDPLTMPPPRNK